MYPVTRQQADVMAGKVNVLNSQQTPSQRPVIQVSQSAQRIPSWCSQTKVQMEVLIQSVWN